MMSVDTSHGLLFGLIALQCGLIDQIQLIAAFQCWTLEKTRPLAEHLLARGDVDADDHAAVLLMVDRHLRKHGGELEQSLRVLSLDDATRAALARLSEPHPDATLGGITADSAPSTERGAATVTFYAKSLSTNDGRFRILRPHAKGGLGEVLVALDEELHREVALKQILEHHADDLTSRTRFVIEAEITGGLEHPGIVPVYGLGTFKDGRPYYAMRFIKGESLKDAILEFHADEGLKRDSGRRSLALRSLLRRFVDVCNAIDYAHTRGVLHRDIKPANVIVGKHGETLVVDWGLAKVVGREGTASSTDEPTLRPGSSGSASETMPGAPIGTPAYMSPEQAAGDQHLIGPQSDVYSLGATLYSILTGRRAFDGDFRYVLNAIKKSNFPKPRTVNPSLDPALEAVCLKAMSHLPVDRYSTARALADDLERWSADEPVTAHRERITRRLRRWGKRHRTGVTVAAVTFLVGMIGLISVLSVQAKGKRDLMVANQGLEARYRLAFDAVKTLHTGLSEDFLLQQDRIKILRNHLFNSAASFYNKLGELSRDGTDPGARNELLKANFEAANLAFQLGRNEDSLAMHLEVFASRKELEKERGGTRALAIDISKSLRAIGRIKEAMGDVGEATELYRESRSLLSSLVIGSQVDPTLNEAYAESEYRLSGLLWKAGRLEEAEAALHNTLSLQSDLAKFTPHDIHRQAALARTHHRIGLLFAEKSEWTRAVKSYEAGQDILRQLVHDYPDILQFQYDLATNLTNAGHSFSVVIREESQGPDVAPNRITLRG